MQVFFSLFTFIAPSSSIHEKIFRAVKDEFGFPSQRMPVSHRERLEIFCLNAINFGYAVICTHFYTRFGIDPSQSLIKS